FSSRHQGGMPSRCTEEIGYRSHSTCRRSRSRGCSVRTAVARRAVFPFQTGPSGFQTLLRPSVSPVRDKLVSYVPVFRIYPPCQNDEPRWRSARKGVFENQRSGQPAHVLDRDNESAGHSERV